MGWRFVMPHENMSGQKNDCKSDRDYKRIYKGNVRTSRNGIEYKLCSEGLAIRDATLEHVDSKPFSRVHRCIIRITPIYSTL